MSTALHKCLGAQFISDLQALKSADSSVIFMFQQSEQSIWIREVQLYKPHCSTESVQIREVEMVTLTLIKFTHLSDTQEHTN